MTAAELDEILSVEAMTRGGIIGHEGTGEAEVEAGRAGRAEPEDNADRALVRAVRPSLPSLPAPAPTCPILPFYAQPPTPGAVSAAGSGPDRGAGSRRMAEAGPDHGRAQDLRRRARGRSRRRRWLVHDSPGPPGRAKRPGLRRGHPAAARRGHRAPDAARTVAQCARGARHCHRSEAAARSRRRAHRGRVQRDGRSAAARHDPRAPRARRHARSSRTAASLSWISCRAAAGQDPHPASASRQTPSSGPSNRPA